MGDFSELRENIGDVRDKDTPSSIESELGVAELGGYDAEEKFNNVLVAATNKAIGISEKFSQFGDLPEDLWDHFQDNFIKPLEGQFASYESEESMQKLRRKLAIAIYDLQIATEKHLLKKSVRDQYHEVISEVSHFKHEPFAEDVLKEALKYAPGATLSFAHEYKDQPYFDVVVDQAASHSRTALGYADDYMDVLDDKKRLQIIMSAVEEDPAGALGFAKSYMPYVKDLKVREKILIRAAKEQPVKALDWFNLYRETVSEDVVIKILLDSLERGLFGFPSDIIGGICYRICSGLKKKNAFKFLRKVLYTGVYGPLSELILFYSSVYAPLLDKGDLEKLIKESFSRLFHFDRLDGIFLYIQYYWPHLNPAYARSVLMKAIRLDPFGSLQYFDKYASYFSEKDLRRIVNDSFKKITDKKVYFSLSPEVPFFRYLNPENEQAIIGEYKKSSKSILRFAKSEFISVSDVREAVRSLLENEDYDFLFSHIGSYVGKFGEHAADDLVDSLIAKGGHLRLFTPDMPDQCLPFLSNKSRQKLIDAVIGANLGSQRLLIPLVPYLPPEKAESILKNIAYDDPSFLMKIFDKVESILKNSNDPALKVLFQVGKLEAGSKKKEDVAAMLHALLYQGVTIDAAVILSDNVEPFLSKLVELSFIPGVVGKGALTGKLSGEALRFVYQLNSLHDEPDSVRYASVEKFDAKMLYASIVYGEAELFTSSFVGLFDRLIRKIESGEKSGYAFLESVGYSKFRTFFKLCVNFGTLRRFFDTMSTDESQRLISRFVSGLGESDTLLEDAVSVADTLVHIDDEKVLRFLQIEIKNQYETNKNPQIQKIYGLLARLVSDRALVDREWFKEIAKRYPFVGNVAVLHKEELFDDTGLNVQRYFFYDDIDGKHSFNHFLNQYKDDTDWEINEYDTYVKVSSRKSGRGKRIEIFANKPSFSEKGQDAIQNVLDSRRLSVHVAVHRGHSYHLENSLGILTGEEVLVSLGSCGGYSELHKVLTAAPKAHVISTRQVGTMLINDPLFKMLNDEILNGRDVDWDRFWTKAEQRLGGNPAFRDYIGPHQNLGMTFLQAYQNESVE